MPIITHFPSSSGQQRETLRPGSKREKLPMIKATVKDETAVGYVTLFDPAASAFWPGHAKKKNAILKLKEGAVELQEGALHFYRRRVRHA